MKMFYISSIIELARSLECPRAEVSSAAGREGTFVTRI